MIGMVVIGLWVALAVAGWIFYRIYRGFQHRRFFMATHDRCSNLPADLGVSVLCSGIGSEERIADLLATEYGSCEVVVVLDGVADDAAFSRLVAHYRMIRVTWPVASEFATVGVVGLYRSRRRSCRRLVLVDRRRAIAIGDRSVSPTEERRLDWNAAATVASYEWFLPVDEHRCLLPDAVLRMMTCIGDRPPGCVRWVESRVGVSVWMVGREDVAAAGGFSAALHRRIPRCCRVVLWEPLARSERSCRCDRVVTVLLSVLAWLLFCLMLWCVWRNRPEAATLALAGVIVVLTVLGVKRAGSVFRS